MSAPPDAPFPSCHKSSHYPSPLPSTPSQLHSFLKSAHVNVIPYNSTSRLDCWDALIELDPGTSATYVTGIYTQADMRVDKQADPSTGWNREHLWPKS
jgi:hypothetical protein